jgi:hypothetical protein
MKQGQHDVARSEDVIDVLDSGHVGLSETVQKLEDATAQALGELGSSDDRSICSNESEGAAQQYSYGKTIKGSALPHQGQRNLVGNLVL